ncbi:polysaccharide lyase family 7 protein [Mariniflexile sp.]|uniref:polysaccharide lyase family 7 protein n=1 Tax=Mariniflexile sp. TaxID=1979402 RepID=UPI00356863C1
MLSITSKSKIRPYLLTLLLIPVSLIATAQKEAGDIDWKSWKVDIPVDGISKIIEGKDIKKALSSGEYREYFKENSNSTIELLSSYLGATGKDAFGNKKLNYSSSELVEVFYDKKSDYKEYWTNSGRHILESRMKAYKVKGSPETCIARIIGIDKNGASYDKIRILWTDGYIFADVNSNESGDGQYKQTRIAKVDNNMFDIALKMIDGRVSLSIYCKDSDVDKKNFPIAEFRDTEFSQNLFRIGNYFNNSKGTEDAVVVQIKYVMLTHSKN